MCEWCSDLRNLQPAKYIGVKDEEARKWLEMQHEMKHFIYIDDRSDPEVVHMFAVLQCPKCNHVFTTEDYDEYMD